MHFRNVVVSTLVFFTSQFFPDSVEDALCGEFFRVKMVQQLFKLIKIWQCYSVLLTTKCRIFTQHSIITRYCQLIIRQQRCSINVIQQTHEKKMQQIIHNVHDMWCATLINLETQ